MRSKLLLALLLLLLAAAVRPGEASGPRRVTILLPEEPLGSDALVSRFEGALQSKFPGAVFTEVTLRGGQVTADQLRQPDLIYALGSAATKAAVASAGGAPVVSCMILSKDLPRGDGRVTGVTLEFPLDAHLKWLKALLPSAQRVGVLYNPAENKAQIELLIRLAPTYGLTPELRQVASPASLPSALEGLANRVDAILGLPDSLVYTPQTAKSILLFSFRNRVPLFGVSASWVKAGALFSLDWDSADLGAQCGDLAAKLLQGESAAPAPPRTVRYSVNARTAEQMKVTLKPEIVRGAANVY